MEIRDLRTFLTVVEAGGVTRGAERLHVVQSAASTAIKRLESELGVVLLERSRAGVRPTEAGDSLVGHAQVVLNAARRAERDMGSRRSRQGRWSRVRTADGRACTHSAECLRLPTARAAGAAVSVGTRIYLLGGVVPNPGSPDPVNASIRTTSSVLVLDTSRFPLRWESAPAMRGPRRW